MNRRTFLGFSTAALLGRSLQASDATGKGAPGFHTANAGWQAAYDKALQVLSANVRTLPRYDGDVLIEGAEYAGVWQECGPQEALVYRRFRPDVARNAHLTFFALQRADGQLPANNKLSETGFGQIQMVVPIAATAWELARATHDEELLSKAYSACSRWDDWLMRYRNTRGTGLVEGFCTYDTGHDNSPRWKGIPNQCPGKDAKRFPAGYALPRLCPDLSATVYGGRMGLSAMADALGKKAEATEWAAKADTLRRLILEKLYVEADAAFYDLDANNRFVKIDCDILSRVCGEHVPDQKLFDQLWTRQLGNPQKFWAPYPLPSVALDDPQFVRPIPRNTWGGPSQALTALRAPRWFDHYGRSAELAHMMDQWCEALQRDMTFRQQMDPVSGEFTQQAAPGYSPAALVMMDYTWRLAGIVETADELWWNVRPGHPASESARFRLITDGGKVAEMTYTRNGTHLFFNGREVCVVSGGITRLVTDKSGSPQFLLCTGSKPQIVRLTWRGRKKSYESMPNQVLRIE